MPKLRYQPPERLSGAADLTGRHELRGSLNTVRLVKSQKWATEPLRKACAGLESRYSRRREAGRWELAAIAFVVSGQVDIEPWYNETTAELWRECGFKRRPSYSTVYRRLRELESVRDEFLDAAGAVIKRCRSHDSRVLAHVHVDATEDETHARLFHDCGPNDNCPRETAKTSSGKNGAARGSDAAAPRASAAEARAQRHQWSAMTVEDGEAAEADTAPERSEILPDGWRRLRMRDGCWYRTRDTEAGARKDTSRRGTIKNWHGFYATKMTGRLTGSVIPAVDSCEIQEFQLFAPLYDRLTAMAGAAPETVIGDRGYSYPAVFEHATRNGTAPVFPWRANNVGKRYDEDTHDRHGVMRCKHYGGPMSQVKFSLANNEPRLWFRCTSHRTAGCEKDQTISCSKDWRLLIPLARTEPLYHELKKSHREFEPAHDRWRDRYKVAADDLGLRPKALGWTGTGCERTWPASLSSCASLRSTTGSAPPASRGAGERGSTSRAAPRPRPSWEGCGRAWVS